MPNVRKRPRARRLLRWVLRGLGALALLLVAVVLLPNRTLNPALRWVGPKIAGWAGWDLRIGSLSGAPWSTWVVKGLSLRARSGAGSFAIEHLEEAQVQWQGSILGVPGLHNVAQLYARGGDIRIDLRPSSEPVPDSSSEPFDPTTLPDLDLDRIALELDLGSAGTVTVHDARAGLRAPGNSGKRAASVRLDGVQWARPGHPTEAVRVEATLDLDHDSVDVAEATAFHPKRGQLATQGHFAWPADQGFQAEFQARWNEGHFGDLEAIQLNLQGSWCEETLRVAQVDGTASGGVSLHGTDLAIDFSETDPWKNLRGELVAGADSLGQSYAQLTGDEPLPLGLVRLEAQRTTGPLQVQHLALEVILPDWQRPLQVRASGSVDFTDPAWPLQAKGDLDFGTGNVQLQKGLIIEGSDLTAQFDLAGPWLTPSGTCRVERAAFACQPLDQPAYQGTLRGNVVLTEGALALESTVLELQEKTQSLGSLSLQGAAGSVQAWIDHPTRVPVDLNAGLDLARLAVVADWTNWVRRIDGNASGRVHVQSDGSEWIWDGRLDVVAPNMRLSTGPSWSEVRGSCIFPGTPQANVEISGIYGGAPVTLTGNARFEPGPIPMDWHLVATGIPLVRTPEARIRANLDLTLHGTADAAKVRGEAVLAYGQLEHDFDLPGKLFSLLEGQSSGSGAPPQSLALEWTVPAGWDVDVELRSEEPIAVVSDLAKTTLSVQGRLIARSSRLFPEGNVAIGSGQVSLPGATLRWQQGLLLLPQGGGEPTIEASGTTRLAGYDVTVRLHGPLREPVLEITSIPSRPRYDLLVLLMTGELPGDRDLGRTTQSLSVYLAKDLLRRWLGSSGGSDEDSLIQRLEITVGREVSESGQGTLEAMFRLQGAADGSGKAIWITAERDRYEDMNFGLRFVLRPR
ncbi:MAG: translocation/assembly module TamB domain-containing protein [Planctomycetes bacterium]|nr:translocation/assembly module TamB domain-containing protein [Planctomycetota bacterium]